jgi:hypothetical protein
MSIFTIPFVPDAPHQAFPLELDGATYKFEALWSERDEAWNVSLYTADEVPLVVGRKAVLNFPLFHRFKDSRLPPGRLILFDTSPGRKEAGLVDLGRRVQLVYFDKNEA